MGEQPATDPPEDDPPDRAAAIGLRVGQALAALAVVVLPVLVVLVAIRTYTAGEIDPTVNPVNTIFASRTVVGAVRIAILFAVVFLIVSLIAAAVRGQFLLQIGPVRLSESVRGVAADRDRLAADLSQAGRTIADLEGKLQDAVTQLDRTGEDLDLALEYIGTLEQKEHSE